MEHDQLINEMPQIERLTTAERLRLARKRRGQQLKRWAQREREFNLKRKGGQLPPDVKIGSRRIRFVASIMLLEAAARNDVDEVRRILELGVSPDSTNEDGLTALHQCCIDDSEEMMKVLVEHGADVNAADSEQWTPLHAAATCGHLHLVKFLVESGADLLAVNGDGNMPYDICEDETTLSFVENEMAKRGVTQELIDTTRAKTEVKMLAELQQYVKTGGDLEFRDQQGATPLHIAAANGYQRVLEFLLDNHASTDVSDNDLWQPIHAAACWGHLEAVEILAQNGADISALTRTGETPFDITEDSEIRERLVELAEQRLRLAEPRVRRGRSASTRTHSIRRTSLRDKINTTKKDLAEEKLIYMKTVRKSPSAQDDSPPSGEEDDDAGGGLTSSSSSPRRHNNEIVDIKDVEISLSSSPDAGKKGGGKHSSSLPPSGGKPVQLVSPQPAAAKPAPPVRPSRGNQPSASDKRGPADTSSPAAIWSSPAGSGSNASPADTNPINIHVSVTINPGLVPPPAGGGGSSNNNNNGPGFPGTLADLKRARSQSRVTAGSANSSSNVSLASQAGMEALEGVTLNPATAGPGGGSPSSGRKKFAASSVEVVGPPSKSGCCVVM